MIDLLRLAWTFVWLSFLAIGGGLGVVPEMQRQVVAHRWVTTQEFVDGYALSQLTPGPTMLVAIFVGYRAHGLLGGIVAGIAMFLPVSVLTAVVAGRWEGIRERPWARSTERALAPIGLGLMAAGVYTLTRTAVNDWLDVGLALAAFVILWRGWLPPIAVVLAAGGVSWLAGR